MILLPLLRTEGFFLRSFFLKFKFIIKEQREAESLFSGGSNHGWKCLGKALWGCLQGLAVGKHLDWARSKLGSLLTPPATATATSEEEHGEEGKDGSDGRSGWCQWGRVKSILWWGGVLSEQRNGNFHSGDDPE